MTAAICNILQCFLTFSLLCNTTSVAVGADVLDELQRQSGEFVKIDAHVLNQP